MINGLKVLALIPARGGSKGIKDKNIIDLKGKPLIAYTIDAAKESSYIDDIVITTDSEKIKSVSEKYGARVPFLRPDELATDTATTLDAVLHAIETLDEQGHHYDVLVLLQPTAPLRTSEDIDGAIEKFVEMDTRSVVSVSEVSDSPILMRNVDKNGVLQKLLNVDSTIRRQDMPPVYRVNGSIYINRINEINFKTSFNDNEVGYIMEKSHSVDIDEYSDLVLAEYYLDGSN